jgi:hypothetical protein
VDYFVRRALNINQFFVLGPLMHLIVTPQKLNQFPIDLFCLPISMWMQSCRSLQLGIHLLPTCSPKGSEKYGMSIIDYVTWYPKVHPNLFK